MDQQNIYGTPRALLPGAADSMEQWSPVEEKKVDQRNLVGTKIVSGTLYSFA